jgi:hypothetical protein
MFKAPPIETFMGIVQNLATGANHYYEILEVGIAVEQYNDPVLALDFLVQPYPDAQEEIRSVIMRALGKYNNVGYYKRIYQVSD